MRFAQLNIDFPRPVAPALACILAVAAASRALAQDPAPLTVATKSAPPFAIQQDDGTWSGISVELWNRIAEDLAIDFEFVDTDLDRMIDGVANGNYDAAVAALTVTAEREQRLDFSHAFFSGGLRIAVPDQPGGLAARFIRGLFSVEFLSAIAALALVLLGSGALVWGFERRKNDQFSGPTSKGLGSGFWWAAVTMTTVGYGDKAPVTLPGRLVALVWMFTSIIVISSFTAGIATSLTLGGLAGPIQGPGDLRGASVGTIADSTSEAYLHRAGATVRRYNALDTALADLAAGNLEAVVYDGALLRYQIARGQISDVRILPVEFQHQDYAIALPTDSPLRPFFDDVLHPRGFGDAKR